MAIWLLLLAGLFTISQQAEQATVGCAEIKEESFVYIASSPQPLTPQKFNIKRPRRTRTVLGVPIPGGGNQPRYEVQVSNRPEPVQVQESTPLFHVRSKTPAERIFAVRLTSCGKNHCFNLYEDGPASMALVKLAWRELGPGCLEFHPQQSLTPGQYALVILKPDFKPQLLARFRVGPPLPEIR
ncbi:MAG: hypothetical protein EHM61_06640 [Acidobacteria bacterium]|nr:MAG: hypothetical protein EHM61_06640 [Acidobacteriota bacterium]